MDERLAESIQQRLAAIKGSGQAIQGSDVLLYLQPASQAGIQVNLPTGKTKRLPAVLVGLDRQPYLYFTFHAINREDLLSYCKPGYRVHVSVICERGLGAMVHFDSVIELAGETPLLITTRVPKQVTINKIRRETRYPVNLTGWTTNGDTKIPIQLTDISFEGCAFKTSYLAPPLKMQHPIVLRFQPLEDGQDPLLLSGIICNQGKLLDNIVYGVKFDQDGQRNSNALFMNLEFNGQMMVSKTPDADALR